MQFTDILWLDILIIIIIIVIILLIYKILIFLIGRAARTEKIPPDVVNGLKIFTRLITVIVIIVLIISFTSLPPEITFAISAIVGTVIGFSSIQAVQNFISGLYILITHPFGINELIAIGDIEGLVSEISLNYTKLISLSGKKMLVSNRNIINSDIVNYTKIMKVAPTTKSSPLKWVRHILIDEEITRYAFTLELPRDNPKKLKNVLEATAEAWKSTFEYKPTYILWGLGFFAIFRIILSAKNPETILKNKPLFIKDLYTRLFEQP